MRAAAFAFVFSTFALTSSCASTPPAHDPAIAAASAPSSASPPPGVVADSSPPCAPEDFDGFQDDDGCLDADNDRDGVLDRNDKCPNEPETFNGIDDEDGCPDKAVCGLGPQKIVILEKIAFEKGSSTIDAGSTEMLHAVAEVIVHHPELALVEVEGFADDGLSKPASLALSTARAKAVVAQLLAHGAPSARVRAKGYGAYCKLDPSTPEKNRRVEFRMASVSSDLIPEELGCAEATANGVAPDPLP